jgi:hypothetical protein
MCWIAAVSTSKCSRVRLLACSLVSPAASTTSETMRKTGHTARDASSTMANSTVSRAIGDMPNMTWGPDGNRFRTAGELEHHLLV